MRKNKLLSKILLGVLLTVTLTACSNKSVSDSNKNNSSNPADIIEEVHSLPDANISIPSVLVGNEISDEKLPVDNISDVTDNQSETVNNDAEENTENESTQDSSEDSTEEQAPDNTNNVTYALTGKERTDIVNGISENIVNSINDILNNKDYYPDIISIMPNSDCTEFVITLKGSEMNVYESMLLMSFYTIGDKYQIYMGVPENEAKTTVKYINGATGEIISETDSTSMEK